MALHALTSLVPAEELVDHLQFICNLLVMRGIVRAELVTANSSSLDSIYQRVSTNEQYANISCSGNDNTINKAPESPSREIAWKMEVLISLSDSVLRCWTFRIMLLFIFTLLSYIYSRLN